MHKVFVYGSLLSGLGNHRLLADSKKLGVTKTPEGFDMIDLGYFPGAVRPETIATGSGSAALKGQGTLVGEVYEVDDTTLNRLDHLEGYNPANPSNGHYNRIEIDTEFGKAFIYLYNNNYNHKGTIVPNGDWRTYYTKKLNK